MNIIEPSLWLFFGRLHPLILHFPVALLIVAAVLELLPRSRSFEANTGYHLAILIVLCLGALSAITAASMGLSLVSSGEYQGETVNWHKRYGISVVILSIFATYFKYLTHKKSQRAFLYPYLITLTFCVSAIFMVGHYGGALTHGSEFLPSAAPEPLASWLRKGRERKNTRQSHNDKFTRIIEPILEEHCFQCHGDNKQQGGLQLNDRDKALEGGDSGIASITPGLAMNSEMIRRLFLPRDNKKAMPPKGRPRPNDGELVALVDWIEIGAPWAGESSGPRQFMADHLASLVTIANPNSIITLQEVGVLVRTINKENPLLSINMSLASFPNQQIIELLSPLKSNIAWLNLANNQLDDDAMNLIGKMSNLTRLSLANNQLNDELAEPLNKLTNLVSLNLTSNPVGKDIINELINLPILEDLYLWQTSVTTEQIEHLKQLQPHINIVAGLDIKLPKPESTPAARAYENTGKK